MSEELSIDVAEVDDVVATSPQAEAPEVTVTELEEEGEVAADYVEELLDICDLDGDIDIDVRDGRSYISVASQEGEANLAALGSPQAVAALQELTRLAVQAKTGRFSRLILDVQNSRERREAELRELVENAVARIDAGTDRVPLAPMTSYERKVIHDLSAERGLDSESEGQGRDRHIVLSRSTD